MKEKTKKPSTSFFYRENSIDVQKNRHDNFSFKKAINTKNSVYGTMHFEGILRHPHKPNMVLYERTPVRYAHFLQNRASQLKQPAQAHGRSL